MQYTHIYTIIHTHTHITLQSLYWWFVKYKNFENYIRKIKPLGKKKVNDFIWKNLISICFNNLMLKIKS